MSELAHRALGLVLSRHGGYLQSYAADRRARIMRCMALLEEYEATALVAVDLISDGDISVYLEGLRLLREAVVERVQRLGLAPPTDIGDPWIRMNGYVRFLYLVTIQT